jgi:hypothetical protein
MMEKPDAATKGPHKITESAGIVYGERELKRIKFREGGR